VLARHPLVFYFLIAFVFSWLTFLPGPLTYYGVLSLSPQLLGYLAIAVLLGPHPRASVLALAQEKASLLALLAFGHFETFLAPQPMHPLLVDRPTFAYEERPHPPVAVARILPREVTIRSASRQSLCALRPA
jgi:hypothetical protein